MTNDSIIVDTTTGVLTATGAVTTGILILVGLLIVGKYFLPFFKWLIGKFDDVILAKFRKPKHK